MCEITPESSWTYRSDDGLRDPRRSSLVKTDSGTDPTEPKTSVDDGRDASAFPSSDNRFSSSTVMLVVLSIFFSLSLTERVIVFPFAEPLLALLLVAKTRIWPSLPANLNEEPVALFENQRSPRLLSVVVERYHIDQRATFSDSTSRHASTATSGAVQATSGIRSNSHNRLRSFLRLE